MFDTVYDNMNNVVLIQHDFFTFLRALIFLGGERGVRKIQKNSIPFLGRGRERRMTTFTGRGKERWLMKRSKSRQNLLSL